MLLTPGRSMFTWKEDKMNMSHCHPVKSEYTTITHCNCYKESKACTNLCRLGAILSGENYSQKTLYKTQGNDGSKKTPKNVKFALDAREHVPSGSQSILEFFIIEFITKYCKREGIETNNTGQH